MSVPFRARIPSLSAPRPRIGQDEITLYVVVMVVSTDCAVGPPLSEPLIGQIVLEALDLIADCTKRTLTPRPESPDYPLLKLK